MQVQVIVNSAFSLKNVNWRFGMLHPYAVVWIDTSRKCSTKVDTNNGMNPVWNEKFTIPLPPTSFPETAILCIDIVHANPPVGTKPLVGSTRFPLSAAINEARVHGQTSFCLNLTRPSGRPQGSIEIKIGIKDTNIGQINQYNQQQIPYKQRVAAQPLPQAQMQPQVAPYQPRPQVPPHGQYQPRPQVQPQGQYQPRPLVQPQGQFQPRPQLQLQGQLQPRPQIQPQAQGQYLPQSQQEMQYQGQFQPQPVVKPQGHHQNQPDIQAKVQSQPRPNPKPQQKKQEVQPIQPMKKQPNKPAPDQIQSQPQPQPNPKSQHQKPAAQPMMKQPNKQAPVQAPNSKGSVRQVPAQGPRNSMPPGTNRPPNRRGNTGPLQQQYNPAYGMGPGADNTRLARDMLFVYNNIAGQGGAGTNDNGETKSAAADTNTNEELKSTAVEADANGESKSRAAEVNNNGETMSAANADYAVNEANVGTTAEMHPAETFNDAESIQLSYEETPNISSEREIGDYDYGENATTEEYGHGGYDVNAGHGGYDNGDYDANAGAEYQNGGYDANAGAKCDYGAYDANAGAECDYGALDANAGGECAYGAYDVNAGEECYYEGYDNGNEYVNGQYEGGFDSAGLDSQVDCGEVDVSCEY